MHKNSHEIMWLKWSDDNQVTSVMTFYCNFVALNGGKVYFYIRVTGGKLLNMNCRFYRLRLWFWYTFWTVSITIDDSCNGLRCTYFIEL